MTAPSSSHNRGKGEIRWRFVVEIPDRTNPEGDPNKGWVYTDVYDSEDEAVKKAQTLTIVRVRQFPVTVFPQDHSIHPSVLTQKPISGPEVPLVDFFCPSDGAKARALETSSPKCPVCKLEMFIGGGLVESSS